MLWLAVCAVAVVFLLCLGVYQLRQSWLPGIPGPSQYPFIGSLHHVVRNKDRQCDYWLENTEKYGMTWQVRLPTFPPAVFLIDPRDVEYVLSTNFENYPKGESIRELFYDFAGDGIFNVNGEEWKNQRQVASHLFKLNSMREMLEIFLKHGHEVVDILNNFASLAKPVDIQTICYTFTLDSISEIAFGVRLNALQGSNNTNFAKSFDVAQMSIDVRSRTPFWKYFPEQCATKAFETLNAFCYGIIKDRRDQIDFHQRTDLLSKYLTMKDPQGKPFSDKYCRDIIMNFMIAGRDTTASTLTWMVYLIAQHPDVEEKLLEEISRTIPEGDNISLDNFKNMPYCKAVIDETLRLYPPVPADPKNALHDDILPSGHRIPAGTAVIWAAYVQGRYSKFWKNPNEFNPERWLDHSKPIHPYQFTPFQAGPRRCLGINMAYLEIKVLISILLRNFHFTLVPEHHVYIAKAITLSAGNGVLVTIDRRNRSTL